MRLLKLWSLLVTVVNDACGAWHIFAIVSLLLMLNVLEKY